MHTITPVIQPQIVTTLNQHSKKLQFPHKPCIASQFSAINNLFFYSQ